MSDGTGADERLEQRLRRLETVLAQARAAVAGGAVPDLGEAATELAALSRSIGDTGSTRHGPALLSLAAEIEMLIRAAEAAKNELKGKLTETGRNHQAIRAYGRAMPNGRG